MHLPADSARLGRCLGREGWLFLCSAVIPLYLVEETGCAYTKSSISFQATHLELGTGKHLLQRQLVHLIATAQTHGEFRKERGRRFASLSMKKERCLTFIMYTGILAWQLRYSFYSFALPKTACFQRRVHQILITLKSQTWKMPPVHIREGETAA